MRKLYYYDNVHQRRRKQQPHQLIDTKHHRSDGTFGDNNRKHRYFREIGAILSNYVAVKHTDQDENSHVAHRHIVDSSESHHHRHHHHHHQQQQPQKQLTQLTKCAKMSEENGMIKSGNLNGVGIARSLSQNLTNFSNFTISPSTTITPSAPSLPLPLPLPPPPPPPPPPSSTTASATAATSSTSTLPPTTGTSNSLANSISNSSNSVRANNNESTASTTSPTSNSGQNGGSGNATVAAASAPPTSDTTNSDFGDQKPANNNNNNGGGGSVGVHPNAIGGRLQIFKDGKFILELACSKEGERSGWVSVPRKTYWPPAAPSSNNNSVNHNKNESSTSLSFSDDNSSIQSSPWQRDHCWKQPSPRRNISKELSLYYCRPAPIVLHSKCLRISKLKSRRPHDTKLSANQRVEYAKRAISSTALSSAKVDETNEKVSDARKSDDEPDVDTVDSGEVNAKTDESNGEENADKKKSATRRATSDGNEMLVDGDDKGEAKASTIKVTRIKRPKLNDILQKLIDKLAEQPHSVVGMQTGPGASAILSAGNGASRSGDLGYYQQHVSPRKRILREFEKVSLEDAANTSTKRSRSKAVHNAAASPDASRPANGNRHANASADGSPKTTQSSTLYPIGQGSVTPVASRPISSYSITSLLGHNSSASTNSTPKLDNGQRTSPKSPQQPSTARLPKKKSPINGSTSVGSPLGLTSSSFGSHRSPMNSPINYGGRSTRSPDVNSPSPDHHHPMRNHAQRYALGGGTSISSPTSGFHPYLPTSRASPLGSGADALSPNALDRYRSSYRAAASPSGTSSSSISGPSHAYASANGSPNAHIMRYSPSTHSSGAQISPPHQKSSSYHINNLLPHAVDSSNGNSTVCRNISISQNYSPNSSKALEHSPPSPPSKSPSAARTPKSTATSNNNTTTTRTIPKKTASLRQQFAEDEARKNETATSNEHRRHGWDASSTPTRHGLDMDTSVSNAGLYQSLPRSSIINHRHTGVRPQPPPLSHFSPAELEQHQAYLAAAALHSLNAPLPLPPPGPPSWSPVHSSSRPGAAPGPFFGGVPPAAMAAAAYLNPLYYHPFRSQFWMPYPPAHPIHPDSEWSGEKRREAERNAAIIECSRSTASEYDSFQSIREEQNSDVPLNLSKH